MAEISNNNDVSGILLEASENLHMVKTAQYLGFQGTAIRNGRCFSNCIRMKKHANPDLKDQEVWSECHKEWITSLYSSGSNEFDKYASSDANDSLKNEIRNKVSSGMQIGESAWKSILEQNFSISHEISRNSKIIRDCASKLASSDNSELINEINKIADQLDVEAEKEFNFIISEVFGEGKI
jgi:hypothetical protein